MPDAPARRPMLGLTASVLAGVAVGIHRPAAPGPALAAAAVAFLGALALSMAQRTERRPPMWIGPGIRRSAGRAPTCAAHAAVALLAFAWTCAWAADRFSAAAWADASARFEVLGIVAAEPDARPHPDGYTIWRFPLALRASRPAATADWSPDAGTVRASWAARAGPRPRYGDLWLVPVRHDPRHPFVGRRVASRPAVRGEYAHARLLARGLGNPLVEWCLRCRRRAADGLARDIEGHPGTSMLHALLLGYRGDIPPAVRDDFATTGTTHIIAISGLNVGLVAAMLIVGLAACGVPRERWLFGVAPVLVVYTIATGLSASAVRACIMALAFFAAPSLDRRPDSASALGLAAVAILAADPGQLFDVGFILSFLAVLGLIALYPGFNRIGSRLHRPDPWRRDPESLPIRALRAAGRHTWALLAASTAAWVVTAPVIATCFGSLSLIGVVTNFIAVPLSFLIVLGGCLSLFFGACWPALAIPFNHANLLLVEALTRSMHALAGIPYACVAPPPPSAWVVAAWYGALAALAALLQAKVRVDNAEANP